MPPHADPTACPTLVRFQRDMDGGTILFAGTPPPAANILSTPVSYTPPPAPSLVGQELGHFRIVRELGRGGMGTVVLAEHKLIQKRVAIKLLHAHLAQDPDLVSRFLSEARTLTLVQHENVVTLYDLDARDGRPYLVMEYLEGQSLASFARGPLAPPVVVDLLGQVCDALGAAHMHGIVHRDLKPANVFLVPGANGRQRVKLLDFGIAKLLSRPAGQLTTEVGVLLGTPEFMAPEQCSDAPVDARTDVYAVGVLGYLLATGQVPFSGRTAAEVLLNHLQKVPVPPHELHAAVPPALSGVLLRALAKRADERYGSAAELKDALVAALLAAPERANTPSRGVHLVPSGMSPRPSVPAQATTPAPSSPPVQASAPVPPSPAAPPTPATQKPQPFTARVRVEGAQASQELQGEWVGRTGLFLQSASTPPKLLSDVGLVLKLPGGELACTGQVVRHVTAEQARAWNMAPGYGVQLRDNSPVFAEALARLKSGTRLDPPTPPHGTLQDDPQAEAVLKGYRARISLDHYGVLELPRDATHEAVRAAAQRARAQLEPLKARTLSLGQRAWLDRALERVATALQTLGHLERRVEFDASLGNLDGIERCLAAGLTATALESCRRRFLSENPGREGRATVHRLSGDALASVGRLEEALASYAAAVRADPLELEGLKRWRSLRSRLRNTPTPR